ncbi:MAG: IPT/TIG domain-containing protein [Candidatus Margulisiibacteriota bacterium]
MYHGALETATDSSLTNGTRYYYRAFSRDLAGHYNTTEVTASATPDAGLPNITSITNSVGVTTNEGKVGNYIEINGTNFGATSTTLTGVRIGGVSISADSGSETSGYEWYSSAKIGVWLPQGVKTGYITVETTAGSRGSTSIFTIKPPDQIYYLNASAGNNQVSLTWANPSETAFSGVLIGRSTSRITWTPTNEVTAYSVGASLISGGKTINFVYNNSGSSTIDATVTNGTQYYYRVYAHDLAGHYNTTEVYDSATPDATAISTVPVITDAIRYLTVSTTTTEVYVGQRMNIQGTNLGAGTYEVYVGGQLAEYDAAADATNNAYFLSVIVPTLRLGSTTVEVVNSYSGERSNVDRVTVIPPQPPYYLNVNSGDSIVSVSWADNTQAGVVATVISRSSTATPESIGTAISGTPILTWTSLTIESQTYLDDDPAEIINGQVYYYNVFAYDGINYSAGYTLQSGETNVGQPAAGATGSSAPQVRAAYGWLSGGAATSSVHVGQLIGISGSNLGAGTYEVYINGVQTTYTTEAQSATFLKVYVPELSAGESSLTVRNAATGVSSDPYTGLTIAAPNPPYYLNVFSENNLVTVNWLDNYADGGVVATYLVKATESEGTPESITDGTVIYSTSEISSNMGAYSDTDVTNGSTYYYNVFSYDGTNYSSGYTLREGETNVGRPQAASAVFSAPHISGVYGWQADGSVTNEVKVGQIIGISGTNLGAGTYEVYVNDTLAAYAAEAQTRYYIKVYVPTIEAGAISIKVSIPATTFESNVYSGLTVVAPNPPYYLNVTSGDGVVNVYWLDNYADGGAVATLIVRSTDGTPESYADGTRIEPGARITDSLHTYVDNVSNGTIYYYNVFSYDGANYSAGYTLQSGETNVGTPAGVASDPAVSQVYYIVSLGAATIGSQTTEAAPGTCISISGARLGASGEVQFTGSGGIDHKLRLYSSDADNVSWWGDGSRVDVKVPSDAQSGYIKIIRGGDEESVQTDYITITNSSGESVHTPSISEISPASGAIGGTVVISGLYFGGEQGANQVAFADSLANTTYAPVTSWIDSRVVAVVPTGLSYQTYNVYLLVSGEATNAKDFTVTTASNMVIDDYEDSTTTNYFTFDSDSSCPLVEVQSSTVAEGSNAMKVAYTFADLSDDWGGGFGKTLGDNLDISSANYIVMYVKGDGSNNAFRLDLKEANSIDGETWSSALVALYNTNWHRVVLNLSAFTRNSSGAVGNGTFDRVIDEYHVVYTSEATSSAYHYIDYIIATTEAVEVGDSTPVIQSVNPREAVVGSTVGIVGSNFGSEEGESQVTLNGTSVGSVIYWSDTLILFNLPTTFTNGKYDLCVYRKNSALSIDELSEAYVFSVIATSTRAKAYPNPFNPLSDGTVKIEVTVTESITVSLYLYDMAARMVDQVTIPLLVGTNQIEWDGRDYTGAVVGDGVYLIRVVNDSTKELIAKGKILVIKRI